MSSGLWSRLAWIVDWIWSRHVLTTMLSATTSAVLAPVWERPDDSLDKPIDDLLSAASAAVKLIGPSDKGRLPAPSSGQAPINILTPSGLHFGQGPFARAFQPHAATD